MWQRGPGPVGDGRSPNGRRPRKELVHKRDELVASLTREAKAAYQKRQTEKSQVSSLKSEV